MSIPFTWVYLIHDPHTGLYKIGQSDNPKARLRELTKRPSTILPTPNDFTIYEAWFCPATKEHEYHKRFASKRKRGEWFELDADAINVIEYDLYDCKRWTKDNQASLMEQDMAETMADLLNSSMHYANGLGMFWRLMAARSGSVCPAFMPTKLLTTQLPQAECFYGRMVESMGNEDRIH